MQEVILFYNGLDVPTRQIIDSKGTSQTRSTKTSDGLAAIQAQLNNLGREIKKVNEKVYVAQVGCEQCKGPHYTKDCLLKEEGASVSVMPPSTHLNLSLGELAHTKLTVELADRTVKHPKGIAENVLVGIELRRDQVDDLMLTIEEGKWKVIDGYRDQDIEDFIFREPFCKASCVEVRRIPEIGFCMFYLYFAQDLAGKDIDKVGKVSII
uniref:Eukaryotic translation initiation factor 3 subunit G N-terminal domain-containing protein n=1 Tax=Tanacetum cinerariifolium TaxID=118510 RepID=A0A699HJ02_TANCI|nr:hypothetical protein [Tanacetum cinerariifolium]